jgi:hypothetical protein
MYTFDELRKANGWYCDGTVSFVDGKVNKSVQFRDAPITVVHMRTTERVHIKLAHAIFVDGNKPPVDEWTVVNANLSIQGIMIDTLRRHSSGEPIGNCTMTEYCDEVYKQSPKCVSKLAKLVSKYSASPPLTESLSKLEPVRVNSSGKGYYTPADCDEPNVVGTLRGDHVCTDTGDAECNEAADTMNAVDKRSSSGGLGTLNRALPSCTNGDTKSGKGKTECSCTPCEIESIGSVDGLVGSGTLDPLPASDAFNPLHYRQFTCTCGRTMEAIDVIEQFDYNIGNAMKYLWRHKYKHVDTTADRKKALWYIVRSLGDELGELQLPYGYKLVKSNLNCNGILCSESGSGCCQER